MKIILNKKTNVITAASDQVAAYAVKRGTHVYHEIQIANKKLVKNGTKANS